MKNIINIIRISRPLHGTFLLISGLIILASILELVAPILSKSIVDDIVLQIKNEDGSITRLGILIAIAFASSMLSLVVTTVSARMGDYVAGRLRQFLTEKFYDKVLTLPQSYFDSEKSGKIVNQLNRGIHVIQGFANAATNFILPAILQSILTVVVLAYYNLPIAIFTFSLFPIYIVISYCSTKKWGEKEVEKHSIIIC